LPALDAFENGPHNGAQIGMILEGIDDRVRIKSEASNALEVIG
jgi:hypothetical protein